MPFTPNPTSVSVSTRAGEVTHTVPAASVPPWRISGVYAPNGRRLKLDYWGLKQTEVGGQRRGVFSFAYGYEGSADVRDQELVTAITNGSQLRMTVVFGDGRSESLSVKLTA